EGGLHAALHRRWARCPLGPEVMSYELIEQGHRVPLRLDDVPRVDVELAREGHWRWRLTFRVRVPGGRRRLRWDGTARSQDAAIAAARARMLEALGGLPERWHEVTPAAARLPVVGWAETLPAKARRLAPLIKAETYRRGDEARTVKRDCMTGRFVP